MRWGNSTGSTCVQPWLGTRNCRDSGCWSGGTVSPWNNRMKIHCALPIIKYDKKQAGESVWYEEETTSLQTWNVYIYFTSAYIHITWQIKMSMELINKNNVFPPRYICIHIKQKVVQFTTNPFCTTSTMPKCCTSRYWLDYYVAMTCNTDCSFNFNITKSWLLTSRL